MLLFLHLKVYYLIFFIMLALELIYQLKNYQNFIGMKTMREMNLYASRAMPNGNEADDRSVLTGVRVMMRAARSMETTAAANVNRIKEQKRGNDGDPRAAMREQLNRARREAADAAARHVRLHCGRF